MSHPQEPRRPVFHFGKTLRMLLPKGSRMSPKLSSLLKAFEETLAGRIEKLSLASKEDVIQLSWMRSAVEEICGLYRDIKTLIEALELPSGGGKDKWMELYFDHSAKVQDIFNSFTSRIRELEECHLHLRHALQHLGGTSPNALISACTYLDKWKQHVASKSSTLGRCFSVMDGLSSTFDLPKVNNSGKEKVLVRAMHGVKVVTLFVCSVFAASFAGSAKVLRDLQVPDTYLWSKAFVSLQTCVNVEMRRVFLHDIKSSHKRTYDNIIYHGYE